MVLLILLLSIQVTVDFGPIVNDDLHALQISELRERLDLVNSACDQVQLVVTSSYFFGAVLLFLRIFSLYACSSDPFFTKAKRYYEKDSLLGEHKPKNCEG